MNEIKVMIKLSSLVKLYHDHLHMFFFNFIRLQKTYWKLMWMQEKDPLFAFLKKYIIKITIGISKKRLEKKYSDLKWPFVFCVCSLQQSYAPPPPPMAPPSPGNTTGGGGGGGGGHGGGLVEQLSKTNLYIRGLPPATTDQDLIKLCQPWVLFSPLLCKPDLTFQSDASFSAAELHLFLDWPSSVCGVICSVRVQ